ncbi:hypothetical protein L7F22_029134 [Adiantum nelumboides]|nr:hypothetical protein [Adiantum nelumboides]
MSFTCSICLRAPSNPVVTCCGHLFCWPCIYRWLSSTPIHSSTCPACKGFLSRLSDFTPLHVSFDQLADHPHACTAHDDDADDKMSEYPDIFSIPSRPSARRKHDPELRPDPDFLAFFHPWGTTSLVNDVDDDEFLSFFTDLESQFSELVDTAASHQNTDTDHLTTSGQPALTSPPATDRRRRQREPPVAAVCPVHKRPHIGSCPTAQAHIGV